MTRTSAQKIIIFAALGLLAAVVVSMLPVAYATFSPLECSRCHDAADFTTKTAASEHAGVECVRCHAGEGALERVAFAGRQVYSMAVPVLPVLNSDSSSAYDARCISCHEDVDGVLTAEGITVDHGKCAVDRACVDCHGTTSHGILESSWTRSYDMELCLDCHAAKDARRDCESCHEGRGKADRTVKGAWTVTHGPEWRRSHGMGDTDTCSACHPDDFCGKCHGAGVPHDAAFRGRHGEIARSAEADCKTCHQTTFCTDCHSGFRMPHEDSFLEQHSEIVGEQGKTACLNCHQQADCDACHVAHIHPGGAAPEWAGGSR